MSNKENKLVVNGQEYQLVETGQPVTWNTSTPRISFRGKYYVGQAVVKQPDNKGFEILDVVQGILNGRPFTRTRSVKRLYDGEVFAIGDEVTYVGEKCSYGSYTIDNFHVGYDGNMLVRSADGIVEWITTVKKIEKPKPLFVTEDGVNVYLDYRIWWVRKSDFEVDFHDFYKGESWYPERFLYFSTKEKAEEYILMNKPLLSFSDLESFSYRKTDYRMEIDVPALKQLAKAKLKK